MKIWLTSTKLGPVFCISNRISCSEMYGAADAAWMELRMLAHICYCMRRSSYFFLEETIEFLESEITEWLHWVWNTFRKSKERLKETCQETHWELVVSSESDERKFQKHFTGKYSHCPDQWVRGMKWGKLSSLKDVQQVAIIKHGLLPPSPSILQWKSKNKIWYP